MMYHFILGFRGCSGTGMPSAVASGGTAVVAAVASILFSSAIIFFPGRSRPASQASLAVEELEQATQSKLDHVVDYPEVCREYENRNDHYGGGRLDLLAVGIVHLLHLAADVFEKLLGTVGPRLQPLAN